jgi:galactonate dehydratase
MPKEATFRGGFFGVLLTFSSSASIHNPDGSNLILGSYIFFSLRCVLAKATRIQTIRFCSVDVTERTRWTFAELSDGSATELVEITCGESTGRVIELLREAVQVLRSTSVETERNVTDALGIETHKLQNDRPLATAVSCIRSGITGLQARQDGIDLISALGGEPKDSVELYANINRSLLGENRTPEAFAQAGEKAAKLGFNIIKCAPFDDIESGNTTSGLLEAAKIGIARVAAVRSAVGPKVEILVDCHSCFDQESALVVAGELANLGIGWFEEPMEPTQNPKGLTYIAERVSMPVAGGESGYGETFFADLIKSGALRIAMPDVKYCGGVAEACRVGRSAVQAAGSISLHSPSGPVSQLASACVTAAIPGAMALESAVDEAPWRAEIMDPPERIENGRFWFPEGAAATLNMEVMNRRGTVWAT